MATLQSKRCGMSGVRKEGGEDKFWVHVLFAGSTALVTSIREQNCESIRLKQGEPQDSVVEVQARDRLG